MSFDVPYCVFLISGLAHSHFRCMRGKHQNLIGRSTAVVFGMVQLNLGPERINHISHKVWPSKDELVARFPKLFSSELGCVNDMEIKLEIYELVSQSNSHFDR